MYIVIIRVRFNSIVSNLRPKVYRSRFIPTLAFGERILNYNFKLNNNNENVITESKRIESIP